MKVFFATMPLAFVIVGCSGPVSDTTSANSVIVSPSSANAAADNTASANGVSPAGNAATSVGGANSVSGATKLADATKASASSASAGAPDSHYKVVADNPGLPPEAWAALQKMQLPPPPASMKVPDKAKVRLDTSQGAITVELNGKEAPLHVKSFLYLAQHKYFDGTKFHRYVPGFVIQGGDPLSKSADTSQYAGGGGPGYEIPREHNKLTHEDMVFAAARSQDPDSAGSQFYITLGPQYSLDQGDGYTVFGKVVAGQDAARKLGKDDTLKSVTILK